MGFTSFQTCIFFCSSLHTNNRSSYDHSNDRSFLDRLPLVRSKEITSTSRFHINEYQYLFTLSCLQVFKNYQLLVDVIKLHFIDRKSRCPSIHPTTIYPCIKLQNVCLGVSSYCIKLRKKPLYIK